MMQTRNSIKMPINVPWKPIATIKDMIDIQLCNKTFPFEWSSSLAISVFEPKPKDLPEEYLCEGIITYLKTTCTITDYQSTREETEKVYRDFYVEVPAEGLDSILPIIGSYNAVNIAVFPYFSEDGNGKGDLFIPSELVVTLSIAPDVESKVVNNGLGNTTISALKINQLVESKPIVQERGFKICNKRG